jgi:hypothetical protein
MDDVTTSELNRRVEELGRRFSDYTRKDVYERDMNEIRHDITEIKDSVRAATRGVLGVFIAIVADVIVRIATSGIG